MPARIASLILAVLLCAPLAYAQTASSTGATQSQLDATQQQIDALKNQIEQLQIQLNNTTKQKQTLQTAIQALDLNIQTLQKKITLTNAQITQTDRQISLLGKGISTTTSSIGTTQQEIGAALRNLAEIDQEPITATILSGGTLSSFFDQIVALGAVRDNLQNRVHDLGSLKTTLQTSKDAAQQSRNQLAALQSQLNQQKQSLALARQSQSDLLAQTKNQESGYQKLIEQKKAEEASFEAELVKLAQGLKPADTTTAPAPRHGILSWPLSSVTVTQTFGDTTFARTGAYNGRGHNGVDFRASIGTPVKSTLDGTVWEINQGAVKNCQYGKWVLVKHDNGLATLYAHLSSIAVTKGQRVGAGQLVGYSGDTGYATGPHLHLTVYIASAVTFKNYTCNSGATAYIPIVPLNAYLDPLAYLPS